MRFLTLILPGAVCALLTPAQEPPAKTSARPDTAKTDSQAPGLDGTRWFVEAATGNESSPKECTLLFEKGKVRIREGTQTTEPLSYRKEHKDGQWHLSFEQKLVDKSSRYWTSLVTGDRMTGNLVKALDAKEKVTFTARMATILDGTDWKLQVQPQDIPDEEEAPDSYTILVRIDRGLASISGEPLSGFRPAPYSLQSESFACRLEHKDGRTISLTARIKGDTLNGSLMIMTRDGEDLERASVTGTKQKSARS